MKNVNATQLQVWDYVSLSCLVTLSSLVGIYHIYTARKAKATRDFLVTNHDLGVVPIILSLVATFYSAIGMLGLPLETYFNGPSFMVIALAFFIVAPLGSFLYMPVFYKLNRISVFEYLELRFNKTIRISASILISFQTLFYTACVIYAPALVLNQVTGLHLWTSVVAVGVTCIIYTSMGGIKAVVWADVTQCIIMIGVLLIVIIKGAINVGGLGTIFERINVGNRSEVFIWTSSPNSQYSIWTMIIGAPFHFLSYLVINQALMQRYLSNKSLKQAQISLTGGCLGISVGQILIPFCGLIMYANFYLCDPLLSGQVSRSDQLMALFAVETLTFCQGLPGVFVAGIMCATLSTLSSTLNSMSAVTLSDYIKPFKPDLSDAASLKISKILVVLYGGLCIAMVKLAESMGGVLKAVFSIYGLTGGPVLTLFTIGMLIPWANSKNAIISFGLSVIIPWWAWLGNFLTSPPINHAPFSTESCTNITYNMTSVTGNQELSSLQLFYGIHSFWYAFWSLGIGLLASLLMLKFTGTQDAKCVTPELLFSFMQKYGTPSTIIKKGIETESQQISPEKQTIQPLLSTNISE